MPLDTEVVARAKALFDACLCDRRKALEHAKAVLMNRAGARNLGQSSYVVNEVLRLCSDELKVLANLAWQDLHRTLELLGSQGQPPVAQDLETAVHALVKAEYPAIESFYSNAVQHQPGTKAALRPELDCALRSVDAEIGLYAAWKQRALREAGEQGGPTILNFYSPVGAVVTGEHAQVTVQQILEQRAAILQALEQVRSAASESSEPQAGQIVEVVAEVVDEVKKEQPNPIKVRGALVGLAGTIQTLASLRPAYDFLKSAAALVGVPLPGVWSAGATLAARAAVPRTRTELYRDVGQQGSS